MAVVRGREEKDVCVAKPSPPDSTAFDYNIGRKGTTQAFISLTKQGLALLSLPPIINVTNK